MKTKTITDVEKRYSEEKDAFKLLNKASYLDPGFHGLIHLKEQQVALLEEMKPVNVAGSEPCDQQAAEKTAVGCLFGDTSCRDSPDQDINLLLQKESLQ